MIDYTLMLALKVSDKFSNWCNTINLFIIYLEMLMHIILFMQVSITLIATGFKRQDEPEGRTSKVTIAR